MSEVNFRVYHDTFSRYYPCDLLVENSVIYECKAVRKIIPRHKNQLLHYLFLANLSHGKIFNFAQPSVQFEFVSTRYAHSERRQVSIDIERWSGPNTDISVPDILSALLQDWGAGLYLHLYEDALVHYLGVGNIHRREIAIKNLNQLLCVQPFWLFPDGSALHFSSFSEPQKIFETNLRKLMEAADLPSIHWINISLNKVTCISL